MGDGKPSIVEKSYKLLFVIYTPIALLSYIINAVGGFKISFLSIFIICVSIISLILTLILVIRYAFKRKEIINVPDSNTNAPFLYRHDFLIPFIFISILSFSILSVLMYNGFLELDSNKNTLIENHQKSKIALILGLTDSNHLNKEVNVQNLFMNYGASEMQGLSLYRQNTINHGNDYNFLLVDHKMVYTPQLELKVKQLLEEGVKYFICTTSGIAVPLSKRFNELAKEVNLDNNPILICTNSSSPNIETKSNSIYRFSIRSTDAARVLAKKSIDLGLTNIAYIAIDDEFGKSSVSTFDKEWSKDGNLSLSGIYLDPLLSKNKIIEKIKSSQLLQKNLDAIFVVNSNSGMQNTITALDSFPDDIIILGTSGLSVKYTQYPIKNILAHKRWFTTTAKSKAGQDIFNFNLYTTFVSLSIDKLTHTIETINKNPELKFHEIWIKTDIPRYLEFDYDTKGDFNIQMEIDSTNQLY